MAYFKLEKFKNNFFSKTTLKNIITEENPSVTNKLIQSIPRMLQTVVDANGLHRTVEKHF